MSNHKPRRDWTAAMMFTMMFGVLALLPVVFGAMGMYERYNPKTGKFVEHQHLPSWPFITVGVSLLLVSALCAYVSWRGRSPLTQRERDVIEQSLGVHLESLNFHDEMFDKGLASMTQSGHATKELQDMVKTEHEDNAKERALTESALAKVDRLL